MHEKIIYHWSTVVTRLGWDALIEDRLRDTGPAWFRNEAILERIDNYLRSGNTFAYLQVALTPYVRSSLFNN